MKRIGKIAVVLVLSLILVFNLCTLAFTFLDLRTRLNWCPLAFLEVESGSMEPAFSAGDLLLVWETPYEELSEGDIITFHHGNSLVTHELVRFEDGKLVTKGLANAIEDEKRVGTEEYCAKLVSVIPKAGALWHTLTSPVSLVLSILLILFLFFGMDAMKKLWALMKKSEAETKRPGAVRVLTSLVLISVLAVSPCITAAKYTAKINRYVTLVASAKYFSSNYISEEGTNYQIRGWNGDPYSLPLSIQNYDNELLFNEKDNDVYYYIRLVKITDGGYEGEENYSLSMDGETQLAEGIHRSDLPDGADFGPFKLEGNDEKGISLSHNVIVEYLGAPEEPEVPEKEPEEPEEEPEEPKPEPEPEEPEPEPEHKIKFRIYAYTNDPDDYAQKLMGDFSFTVAENSEFIIEKSWKSAVGTALVTYSFKTSPIGGDNTRDIKVSWNSDKLYINEYEANIQNLIMTDPSRFVREDGTKHGYAILKVAACSSINLQFFKYEANDEIEDTDITVSEIEETS